MVSSSTFGPSRRLARRAVSVFLATSLAAICASACQEAPPAYPSALVTVDTDLAVPRLVSRLRVDIFNERGAWIDQRQFSFTDARAWPVSFGIVMRDDTRSADVMLRLRAFSSERDYRGERFFERKAFVNEPVASSLTELCANAPTLPHATVLVQRAGKKPLFPLTCSSIDAFDVSYPSQGGSVAAYVDIPKAGKYRFEVVTSLVQAFSTHAYLATLHLLKDCMNPAQAIECSSAQDTANNRFGHIERDMQPGRYALVTGEPLPTGGYVALRWAASEEWGTSELPPPKASDVESGTPLKMAPDPSSSTAGDRTPTTEPAPDSTIDRLVRLHLEPGQPVEPHILLTGACAGTMAKLAFGPAASNGTAPVLADQSATCVSDGTMLEPVVVGETPFDVQGRSPSTRAGTFVIGEGDPASGACAPDDSTDAVVCVPAGAFTLGEATEIAMTTFRSSVPSRTALMRRFFIDRRELTVGDYRVALARGLRLDNGDGTEWLHPEVRGSSRGGTDATFSIAPEGREDFPLNAILWEGARKICQFFGGDLPTEAQWERAASFDVDKKRKFPWGDAPPTCDQSVYGQGAGTLDVVCKAKVRGPVAVTSPALDGDVSFLGIRGLGGNVREWVMGSHRTYDDACWRGAGPIDPMCFDENDAGRVTRGGGYKDPPLAVTTFARRIESSVFGDSEVGFRCAYTSLDAVVVRR